MKKKIVAVLPFIIIPIFIPIYTILDSKILVDIFGCGCVPSAQTNMLNIPFNANEFRLTVFSVLTIGLSVWSIFITKAFKSKIVKSLYCVTVILLNVLLTMWVVKTFMWAQLIYDEWDIWVVVIMISTLAKLVMRKIRRERGYISYME